MDDAGVSLQATMADMGRTAREGARALRLATPEQRTAAIRAMAAEIRKAAPAILAANAQDLSRAEANGVSGPMLDRLALDEKRLEGVAAGVEAVAEIADPLGVATSRWTRPNGLDISRVRTPIGVIAMIYESRPNVTADAAALCVRSGNAVILRGGSECIASNLAIHTAIERGLETAGLPASAVQAVKTPDRAAVGMILQGLDRSIDLIIPRGGKSLVARVQAEARAPVLGHLEGLNHVFVHAAADPKKAVDIVVNAKLRRVSVCGSAETLLVDKVAAETLLPPIAQALLVAGCELRGDAAARAIVPAMKAATTEDWTTEYLAAILAVAVVDGVEGAAAHIAAFGSGHTDAIVTEDEAAAETFVAAVDSAIVLVNASTQFADGGEFGFGAEIGIATDKLHARGPVGAEQLTTFKYVVRGTGQTRP
ncbi:glutamate-5-semialdehyde dehydrogenase [Caulobacter segnis]|uniref:Gamma-glutamyl phosphate reductase n=2 Tax=Caulobacter segnis TaxID=88688 RepID=D5VHB3_CAUST|nr:glutamate-5-semialdehyde dehydrogenase [Caulobacter segnis]ADG08771.1 gamma-glutamyl phosphate reductase [Caulobacter segnis ATCC 21756]AVQ00623.1 glutamate-5-semialdehyde dehydrogenase [Caulobacter segnis]